MGFDNCRIVNAKGDAEASGTLIFLKTIFSYSL